MTDDVCDLPEEIIFDVVVVVGFAVTGIGRYNFCFSLTFKLSSLVDFSDRKCNE